MNRAYNQLIDFAAQPVEPDSSPLHLADKSPPWRAYAEKQPDELLPRRPRVMQAAQAARGRAYIGHDDEARLVTAALLLRRPLLVTGPAGIGKSTLAYAVAWRLGLGNVLRWGITSRSMLKDGLYHYDAIGRLHETQAGQGLPKGAGAAQEAKSVGRFIKLGPLGTALVPTRAAGYFPRALLIDEIDKGDADFPGDLLHVFEEGAFYVSEIGRLSGASGSEPVPVSSDDPDMPHCEIPASGWVRCDDFPFVVMTSNGEREFPPAFLRRCLRLDVRRDANDLVRILAAHLGKGIEEDAAMKRLIEDFCAKGARSELATDQLLNAAFLTQGLGEAEASAVRDAVFRPLSDVSTPTAG